MELRKRLGASARAFMNPALREARPIPPPEPTRVVVDKLLGRHNVLVSGAGRNIGRSIALEMASHGANVYCTELDPERARALEAELSALPVSSRVFCSNITKPADSEAVCAALCKDGIGIDVLVNNVGIGAGEPREIFETNVIGPMYLTDLVKRTMVERAAPASIIFVTSIHQHIVRRDALAYAPSKGAIGMLIKELAVELAAHRIRVNGIAPGWTAEDAEGLPIPHGWAPLEGTSIIPRYIGRAAVYLASDYFSRYTTGAVITIDAGLSLFNHLCAAEAGLNL